MKDLIFEITENICIVEGSTGRSNLNSIYRMKLAGDCGEFSAPGQFVNIKLDGHYLRRPISICEYDDGGFTIIYKVVGDGTKAMSKMKAGQSLPILAPLGNGYDLEKIIGRDAEGSSSDNTSGNMPRTLLIGGGVGVPPMYGLAKALIELGQKPSMILGFNTKNEAFYIDEFKALGLDVTVTTVDGSLGLKGFVTDAFGNDSTPADAFGSETAPGSKPGEATARSADGLCQRSRDFTYVCACGPEPMLRAICGKAPASWGGQFSFEARMACGFGACMGCSCETKYGYKRICKDGPVLDREEIIW